MGWDVTLRAALSLLLVLGLIVAAGLVAKKINTHGGLLVKRNGKRRLAVVESLSLDGRRRLLLVRKDATEHLILVGGNSDLVIEQGAPQEPFKLGESG